MRGNFAEAAMSAVAAIPFAGDAVGAVKIAGKGAKLVTIGKKLEFSGGKTPKGGDSSPSKPRKGIKDKVKGLGEKLQNLLTGGDPINVVTGSFLMQYIDLQLRDTGEIFYLTRTFESVYENPDRMLGRKWFLSIETRLSADENRVTVQLPDMNLIDFSRTEYGWENKKGNDRTYQLQETKTGYRLIAHQEKKNYYYSQDGKIQEITDRNNNTTRFWYENNYLTKITYQNNSSTCYEYDNEGNIRTIIDQMGNRYVTNEYDRKGRVVRQILADGSEYVMFYNDAERKSTFTNLATGEKTEYEYNRDQVVTKVIYADGTTEEYGYDMWENRIFEKDRNGNETTRTYDIYGNITEEKQPSGLITTTEYDVHQNKVRQYDNAGGEVVWEYDEKSNIIAEKMLLGNGKWCHMYFTYDSMGRLLKLTNPLGNQIEYEYETSFSEPTAKLEPEGEETRYSYDESGRCLLEKTSKGEKRYTYNRTDCVTQIKDEEGRILRYNYDPAGKQTGIVRNSTEKVEDVE